MASQVYLEKMQVRQNYRNVWHTDLIRTFQTDAPCIVSSLLSYLYEYVCIIVFVCLFVCLENWSSGFRCLCRLLLGLFLVSAAWSVHWCYCFWSLDLILQSLFMKHEFTWLIILRSASFSMIITLKSFLTWSCEGWLGVLSWFCSETGDLLVPFVFPLIHFDCEWNDRIECSCLVLPVNIFWKWKFLPDWDSNEIISTDI